MPYHFEIVEHIPCFSAFGLGLKTVRAPLCNFTRKREGREKTEFCAIRVMGEKLEHVLEVRFRDAVKISDIYFIII